MFAVDRGRRFRQCLPLPMKTSVSVSNDDVAKVFDEIADLLEIDDANPFRVRAYRNAARTIQSLGRSLQVFVDEGRDLKSFPGIGQDLAVKIEEMLRTGRVQALDALHRKLPASLEELLRIPGMGPKRVQAMYHQLGIKNLSQLERAARSGRLRELPGFGPKLQQQILGSITAGKSKEARWSRTESIGSAGKIVEFLRAVPGVAEVVPAGSYRRGKESIGDLDVLVTATDTALVMRRFADYEDVQRVVSSGSTRSTVILRSGLQVDVRAVDRESFGAALHYFTGSKSHNIQVRRLGQKRGLKINEYGVFKGKRRIAGKTEKQVFAAVGLPWVAPELREGGGEIEAARRRDLPHLIERKDLRGDLHTHSRASDGKATIKAMALAARDLGLQYIAVTDHSKHLAVARGLDEKRLMRQLEEIDRVNEAVSGITVFKGIEVDILEDGSLDLSDTVLARLDLVIGAVHSHFQLPRRKQTERILRAMDHGCFSILAHPGGRLIGRREGYDVDMERVIRQAADRGCFLELNGQPKRLDLTDVFCRMARDAGVLVCVNSDAHSTHELGNLDHGVVQARRGWLEKNDVLNSRTTGGVKRLLKTTMHCA